MSRDAEKRDARGRSNQKNRTRKDLLQAASRLIKQGRKPSLEEVAEEALVSRATVYRYFQSIESLMLEAAIDVTVPGPDTLFDDSSPIDPIERLERVDVALHDTIAANEIPLRLMLANSLEAIAKGIGEGDVPVRQNRRAPLIEAALEPARAQFAAKSLETLRQALSLVVGTEAMVVCKDVLQLDETEARKLRHWAIRALVDAARKPAPRG